ncbi:butyrophilin subfamily 1 member A1-like [Lacerta agilis]|uniref:butyrophilin subfamily 1 member A1-like n=1 Tax=Lacerta agilis TaxID=80427 RepID=UPI00141998D3|nr:butyrophilin subfamily 1 member A1-like [Lacerta agilis]
MQDEEGYMAVDERGRNIYTPPVPPKAQESPSKCCNITLRVLLAVSIALNVGLSVLLIVFQIKHTEGGSCSRTLPNSCDSLPGSPAAHVTLDPDTAHRRLVVSKDEKSVRWGEVEQTFPNNAKRFNQRAFVLGREGFASGKHCWEVGVKGKGEWAVGVAKESVKRDGPTGFSPAAGIWGVGEYEGLGNYIAFTSPQHKRLSVGRRPRKIRVFLDYTAGQVDFFDPETQTTIYTFGSATFGGGKVLPWFRVWDGTELIVRP